MAQQPEPRWLTPIELRAWLRLVAVVELLPGVLDAQLRRDAGLTHFEYQTLAMLSESPRRTLRMSVLAERTAATLPRLSHVVTRLASRGLVERCAAPEDRRATDVVLTEAGWDEIVAAAPGHVATARAYVVDALDPDQVRQLDAIARAMLERLDPGGRMTSALPGPEPEAGPEPGPQAEEAVADSLGPDTESGHDRQRSGEAP